MLSQMETGNPFSARIVKYDRKRKKGGEVMDIKEARLLLPKKKEKAEKQLGRKLTGKEEEQWEADNASRIPNHRKHYTRNIRLLADGVATNQVIKIHPPLVIKFNGEKTAP